MSRTAAVIARCAPLMLLVFGSEVRADEVRIQVRGVLVSSERVTQDFLASWKANGATAIVVTLDEASRRRWGSIARDVEQARMSLWPWVEVARNPAMADAHPEWMAAIGGHHDDWRRRFPNAPASRPGEVIKAWPWVPIGYAAAFEAHRDRLKRLLSDLPGSWSGVFLDDLQSGPSSCGCGNDQCRWTLDYGSPATAAKRPGDDSAAKMVAELVERHPGKAIVPVWVTECEPADLPDAKPGTKLCGSVACQRRVLARVRTPVEPAAQGDRGADRAGPLVRDIPARPGIMGRDRPRPLPNAPARRHPAGPGEHHRRRPGLGEAGDRFDGLGQPGEDSLGVGPGDRGDRPVVGTSRRARPTMRTTRPSGTGIVVGRGIVPVPRRS